MTASLIRSVEHASRSASAESLSNTLISVGWPQQALEGIALGSDSYAVIARLAGQPQVVITTEHAQVISPKSIARGYSSEAPYTLTWGDDLVALHETSRWDLRPGDAPLVQDDATSLSAKANILELLAPESVASNGPRFSALRLGRAQPDLAEGLGDALALLRRSVQVAESSFDWTDLDQQVLRLFHQLLFIRFFEDRNPNAAAARVETLLGLSDIPNGLAGLLADYSARLRSELFTRRSLPAESVPPTVLRRVLTALTEPWTELRLDFRLTPNDVSGRLYESYLGKQPAVQREDGTLFPVVGTADDRSQRGSFYTPTAVAERLAESVMQPWLDRTRPQHPSEVTVLDPACGSGAFLLAAFRKLRLYFEGVYGRPLHQIERRELLSKSIFGADLDESALMLAQVALYEEADLGVDSQLPAMGENLVLGDSLLSPPGLSPGSGISWTTLLEKHGKFDIVLANPPFGAQRSQSNRVSTDYRQALRSIYRRSHAWGADLAYYFVELSLSLLDEAGVAGFVLPRKAISGSSSRLLREQILSRGVVGIEDYRGSHLFPNVQAYVCLMSIGAGDSRVTIGDVHDSRVPSVLLLDDVSREDSMRITRIPEDLLRQAPTWTAFDLRWQILGNQVGRARGQLSAASSFRLASGTQTGDNGRFVIPSDALDLDSVGIKGHRVPRRFAPGWVKGPDIRPFRLLADPALRVVLPFREDTDEGRILSSVIADLGGRPKNVQLGRTDIWLGPKVLVRAFGREPCAVIDPTGDLVAPKGTAGAFAVGVHGDDLRVLLGVEAVLNSSFYQWWLRGVGEPRHDETIELTEAHLQRLPWPHLTAHEWELLAQSGQSVRDTLSLENPTARALAWWDARLSLDNFVFEVLDVEDSLRSAISRELFRPA